MQLPSSTANSQTFFVQPGNIPGAVGRVRIDLGVLCNGAHLLNQLPVNVFMAPICERSWY